MRLRIFLSILKKALSSYIYIYMLIIAGQTAELNWLTNFEGTHWYPIGIPLVSHWYPIGILLVSHW